MSLNEIGLEMAAQEIEHLTETLDIHKHNIVNYSHFIAATIDQQRFLTKERIWATFKYFDKNNIGLICKESVKKEVFKECGFGVVANEAQID